MKKAIIIIPHSEKSENKENVQADINKMTKETNLNEEYDQGSQERGEGQ